MTLPLYQLPGEYERERINLIELNRGNTGLLFNKYCNFWDNSWTIADRGKLEFIEKISKTRGKRDTT